MTFQDRDMDRVDAVTMFKARHPEKGWRANAKIDGSSGYICGTLKPTIEEALAEVLPRRWEEDEGVFG